MGDLWVKDKIITQIFYFNIIRQYEVQDQPFMSKLCGEIGY